MKSRYLKPLLTLLIIVLILFSAYKIVVYYLDFDSSNGGATLKGNQTLTYTCDKKLKYLYITLDVDISSSNQPTMYYIKNPDGVVLYKGEIDQKTNHLSIDKRYPGAKGTWQIEFKSKSSNEVISCNYYFISANVSKNRIRRR